MSKTPDSSVYSGRHAHPMDPTVVEIVGYERKDGEWDVFVFGTSGSCPEYEDSRIDEYHMFAERIASLNMLDAAADRIKTRLSDGYRLVAYYRESGSRRTIQRIRDHLRVHGASGISVHSEAPDSWMLYIRRKDVLLAEEVIAPNV